MYSTKLISITKPSEEMMVESGAKCAEDIIAFCARVSNPKNQENFDTAFKLLKYCMEKSHWSIFEMANMVLEIKCTRDIGRQILRHRSFSFQEFSQRYAKVSLEDCVIRGARLQDTKNRQNSLETDDMGLRGKWYEQQEKVLHTALEAYNWALDNGIAKEQARVVLPEGLTPSTMYMNGTIRSWIHYCMIRRDLGTQFEHRLVAESAWGVLKREFKFLQEVN